jgi:hypothetical protein
VAAASRAARVSTTMSDISGVLSNNAASLIANNAGNLVSDHGASFRLMAATPTPGPNQEAFEPIHFVSETDTLVYKVDSDEETKGGFKSYDKAGYHAGKLDEALVDDFGWDDVKNFPNWGGDQASVAVEHHLVKHSSKRLPFGDRFVSREIFRLRPNATMDGVQTDTVGWEIEFGLDVALLGGALDHATFKAVAGENDLTVVPASDGTTLVLPTNTTLTGSNARGAYTGRIETKGGALNVQITHATADGAKTEITIATTQAGATHEVVGIPGAHLILTADVDQGRGTLTDDQGEHPLKLGDVKWDAGGLATITLADGSTLQARLF